jgi:hypothetical protein
LASGRIAQECCSLFTCWRMDTVCRGQYTPVLCLQATVVPEVTVQCSLKLVLRHTCVTPASHLRRVDPIVQLCLINCKAPVYLCTSSCPCPHSMPHLIMACCCVCRLLVPAWSSWRQQNAFHFECHLTCMWRVPDCRQVGIFPTLFASPRRVQRATGPGAVPPSACSGLFCYMRRWALLGGPPTPGRDG